MCCFSSASAPGSRIGRLFGGGRAHVRVSNTSIFARREDAGTQLVVYSMTLAVDAEVAMILPVPTVPSAAEDSLEFIDLHAHPQLFTELAALFDPPVSRGDLQQQSLPSATAMSYLKVHTVGSFVASFVPRRADFARLEPRFRLPDRVWDAMPAARDFGFAVFQLAAGDQQIHPMAFRFLTRDPERLFFPTVHVHDGRVHAHAAFDHTLYYQPPSTALAADGDEVSDIVATRDYGGIVQPGQPVRRRTLRGRLPNRDQYIAL